MHAVQACLTAEEANSSAVSIRVCARDDVVPVKDVLAERPTPIVPRRARACPARSRAAPGGRRRRTPPSGSAHHRATSRRRPPRESIALRMMKSSDGGFGRLAGEQAHGQVERSPPGVDRRRAPAEWRPQRRQDQRGASRRGEERRHLVTVVASVLGVLIQWCRPGRLLRRQVDLDLAAELATAASTSFVTAATGRSGASAVALDASVVVLDERLVAAQVERDDERAGAVRRRQRQRLPAARTSVGARRAGAAARAGRAWRRASPEPACARAACRRLSSTPRTGEVLAMRRATAAAYRACARRWRLVQSETVIMKTDLVTRARADDVRAGARPSPWRSVSRS